MDLIEFPDRDPFGWKDISVLNVKGNWESVGKAFDAADLSFSLFSSKRLFVHWRGMISSVNRSENDKSWLIIYWNPNVGARFRFESVKSKRECSNGSIDVWKRFRYAIIIKTKLQNSHHNMKEPEVEFSFEMAMVETNIRKTFCRSYKSFLFKFSFHSKDFAITLSVVKLQHQGCQI